MIYDLIYVHCAYECCSDARNVVSGSNYVLILLVHDDQCLLVSLDVLENLDHFLGLRLCELELVYYDQLVVSNLSGECRLKSKSLKLLVQRISVISWLWCEYDSSADL
jgi:hypothetical protein